MARRERPLPVGNEVLLHFATDLRQLRQKAGNPTYRELVKRAHYSLSTLSDAASGRKLPSLAVTLAYVRACEGNVEDWEQRWHMVAAELAAEHGAEFAPEHAEEAGEPGASGGGRSPYVGLSAFQLTDADLFFGREKLVDDLVNRLSRRRFVALFGASGAGKSSLLRAGLLARWRAEDQQRPVLLFAPGPHPLEECAIQLAGLTNGTPGQLRSELADDPRTLHRITRQALVGQPDEAELLVVVDQFEEIFTLCRDQTERGLFIDALIMAARNAGSRCRVVVGVRADFYAHCTGYPELLEILSDAQVGIGPMTTDELRRTISQPAARSGCVVEGALLAELIAHANGQVGVLPLLSHALRETWRRRRGTTLTLAAFQSAGGIDQALARTAESLYTSLTLPQRQLAKGLFLRLTALGEGTEDTKGRICRAEWDTGAADTAVVLERLTGERLLTVDQDSIEITHEALIRCWPRLHEWLIEDREGLRIHHRLTEAAQAWASLGRDPDALYRGARLALARERSLTPEVTLTALEQTFLDASLAARDAEQAAARRRGRRLRQLVALLTVLLVLATAATVIAVGAQRTATEQRNIATAQRTAERAAALRGINPALAAQLSLAAYRLAPNEETRSSLLSTFAAPYATRLTGHRNTVEAVAFSPDGRTLATASTDHTVRLSDVSDPHHPRELTTLAGDLRSLAFSPDGRTLAAGGDDAVLLWDVTDPRHPSPSPSLTGQAGPIEAVAFSPDGRSLAAANADHTVRLCNVAGRTSTVLTEHTGPVTSVAFSPDGRSVASASADRTVRLSRVADGTSTVFTGHTDSVNSVAFGPDGATVASVGSDYTVRLWNTADRTSTVLTGHTDIPHSVAFSPDGRTLASGGVDAAVRLWNVADLAHRRDSVALHGHTGVVTSIAFSPDGRTLATGSTDQTTRLWDLPGPLYTGHGSSVYGVSFSPDARTLATSSYDRTVRLWDVASRSSVVLDGHTGPVTAVVFSPDGATLASSSADHTARLWNTADHTSTVLAGHADTVETAEFSRDGRTLATGGFDDTAMLWDVADPSAPTRQAILAGHTDAVGSVVFSPDGQTVATASYDHTVRLWDTTGRTLAVLTGHTDMAKAAAFSPDGHILATAGADRSLILWDVTDRAQPIRLATRTGYTEAVRSMVFSPDGHTLATASADRSAVLWDVTDPRDPARLATLTGHTKPVDALTYSPDGHTLATGGEDWTAILWETDPELVAGRICAMVSPTSTPAEWNQYLPGIAYQPPCPPR